MRAVLKFPAMARLPAVAFKDGNHSRPVLIDYPANLPIHKQDKINGQPVIVVGLPAFSIGYNLPRLRAPDGVQGILFCIGSKGMREPAHHASGQCGADVGVDSVRFFP